MAPGRDSLGIAAVIAADGGERTVFLPAVADTSLWKGSRTAAGAGMSLALRDARYAQALVRVDCSAILPGPPAGLLQRLRLRPRRTVQQPVASQTVRWKGRELWLGVLDIASRGGAAEPEVDPVAVAPAPFPG